MAAPHLLVKDIMTPAPLTVQVTDRVSTAVDLMRAHQIRHLPVMQSDVMVGILTDRDLRWLLGQHMHAQDRESVDLKADLVGDVMSSHPVTVPDNAPLAAAVDLLVERRIGGLPVVSAQSGRLVGICTYVDVLRAFRRVLGPGA